MYVSLETQVDGADYHMELDGSTKEEIQQRAKKIAEKLGISGAKWSVSRSGRKRHE